MTFNRNQFNGAKFNQTRPNRSAAAGGGGIEAEFNGLALNSMNIVISTMKHRSGPYADITTAPIARRAGRKTLFKKFDVKRIELRGYVLGADSSDLNELTRTIKRKFNKQDGTLKITREGETLNYVGNLTNFDSIFDESQGGRIDYLPFVFMFDCIDPYGKKTGFTSQSNFAVSDLETNITINNEGTADAEPVFIFIFSAADTVTAISIENLDTGEKVSLTKPVSAGEIVIFNSENSRVTIDNEKKQRKGPFPVLIPGRNTVKIVVTGASATFDLTAKYKQNEL